MSRTCAPRLLPIAFGGVVIEHTYVYRYVHVYIYVCIGVSNSQGALY